MVQTYIEIGGLISTTHKPCTTHLQTHHEQARCLVDLASRSQLTLTHPVRYSTVWSGCHSKCLLQIQKWCIPRMPFYQFNPGNGAPPLPWRHHLLLQYWFTCAELKDIRSSYPKVVYLQAQYLGTNIGGGDSVPPLLLPLKALAMGCVCVPFPGCSFEKLRKPLL